MKHYLFNVQPLFASWLVSTLQNRAAIHLINIITLTTALLVSSTAFATTTAKQEITNASLLPLEILSINTLLLLCLVTCGVLLLGVGLAWLTSNYRFPGSRQFSWLLLLPLAIPAYILGFLLTGDISAQNLLPTSTLNEILMPDNLFALLKTSTLYIATLYPLVYIPAQRAFQGLTSSQLETSTILGLSQGDIFFHVILPNAKAGITAGLLLTLVIVLSDFAAPAFTGFPTLTSGLYSAWEQTPEIAIAWVPATALMLIALTSFLAFQILRGRATPVYSNNTHQHGVPLQGMRGITASLICISVLFFTLALPGMRLFFWLLQNWTTDSLSALMPYLAHSASFSLTASLLTLFVVFLIMMRFHAGALPGLLSLVMALFNNIPMPFLAITILFILHGLPALMLVYIIHVLPVAMAIIQSGIAQTTSGFSETANSLGLSSFNKIRKIYLPSIRFDVFIAALLVAVIVFRELPASYLLQSEGWETLSVQCFKLVANGSHEQASLAAIVLILVGLIPIPFLARKPSTLSQDI